MSAPKQKKLRNGIIVFNTRQICPQSCDELQPCDKFDTSLGENILIDVADQITIYIGGVPANLVLGQYILPGKLFKYHNIQIPQSSNVQFFTNYKIDPILEQLKYIYFILLNGLHAKDTYSNDGFLTHVTMPSYEMVQQCHVNDIKVETTCNFIHNFFANPLKKYDIPIDNYTDLINHNAFVDNVNAQIDTLCERGLITFFEY